MSKGTKIAVVYTMRIVIGLFGILGLAFLAFAFSLVWSGGRAGGMPSSPFALLFGTGVVLVLGAWLSWHDLSKRKRHVLGPVTAGPYPRHTPKPPRYTPLPYPLPAASADESAAMPAYGTGHRYVRHVSQIDPHAEPEERRSAALAAIGLCLLEGANWREALTDARWASMTVFLHCERDKLDPGADDVDGLYLTPEAAQAAADASPQVGNSMVWKVFVSQVSIGSFVEYRKARPHLVRAILKALEALPPEGVPGTPVRLGFDGRAWLDSSGARVVLFEADAHFGTFNGDETETCVFRTEQGAGLFDAAGKVLVAPCFDDIREIRNGLASAKSSGAWGFIDATGAWQIPPQFDDVESFLEASRTTVRSGGRWGAIGRNGNWLVHPEWDSVELGPDGSFRAVRDGKCGYLDAAGRNLTVFREEPFWLDECTKLAPPPEALVLRDEAHDRGRYALGDASGNRLTEYDFDFMLQTEEGLVMARQASEPQLSGYLDTQGKIAVAFRFKDAGRFSEGLACVSDASGRYGFIDRHGEVVISMQFADARVFSEGLAAVAVLDRKGMPIHGYIDRQGAWAIAPCFAAAGDFREGLAEAREGDGWGYIDRQGDWVIAPVFVRTHPFKDGVAYVGVEQNGKYFYGHIDPCGRWVNDAGRQHTTGT